VNGLRTVIANLRRTAVRFGAAPRVIDRSRHEHAARRRTGGCDRRLLGEAVRREQGNLLVDFARSQADGTLAALSEGHSDTEN